MVGPGNTPSKRARGREAAASPGAKAPSPELGFEKRELRIELNSDGYNQLVREMQGQFSKVSERTDFYFDVLLKDAFLLRGSGESPTKVRIKRFKDGGCYWQVTNRKERLTIAEKPLPVTCTTLEVFERELGPKEAEKLIKQWEKLRAVIAEGAQDQIGRRLRRMREVFLEVHQENPLPGADIVAAHLGEPEAHLVPLYTNTKKKHEAEIDFAGARFKLQARQVNYLLSPTDPHSLHEIEVEPVGVCGVGQIRTAADDLAELLRSHGLKERHLPEAKRDPSAAMLAALKGFDSFAERP